MDLPLYVTCCARTRDRTPGPLPAAWRYRSSRIAAVLSLAVEHGVAFRILAGAFGLVAAAEPVPDLDHVLTADQVPALAGRVAEQLRAVAPVRVVCFSRDAEADPEAQLYRVCCEEACRLAGVPCRVVVLPAGPVDMAMLEMMG